MNRWVKWIAGAALAPLVLLAAEQINSDKLTSYSESDIPKLTQEPQHRNSALRITDVFTQSHYKQIQLNDAFSEKIFDGYLDLLDYNRQILLQKDVDHLARYKHNFDDYLKKGKLDDAYAMFEYTLALRFQRLQQALKLIDKGFDFSKEESVEYDRHELQWATDAAELDEVWRKQVKADALNLVLSGKTAEEAQKLLKKRYNYALKRLTQTNSEDVFQLIMNAFARSIEAHTSYLSPARAERFKQDINLKLEGIGAVLQSDYDYTIIRRLVVGGPAEKSGQLSPDDKIIGVAQDDKEMVNIVGWRLDEVVELIKGRKGTTVNLEVIPVKGGVEGEPKIVSIVRDEIKLEDQAAKTEIKMAESGPYQGRPVAVITIPGFYNGLTEDVRKQLSELKLEKVEAVIVDLRGNGGGALPEAIGLTGLFIDSGPVVQRRDLIGRVKVDYDRDPRTYYEGPLVVMVNRYSASASEIFAAALQDYGRALIIGEQTFGKGTVQNSRPLNRRFDFFQKPLGDIHFTTAKFYRINGGSTQNKGVIPDILFPQEMEPSEYGESQEKNALPWDHIKTANFTPRNNVNGSIAAINARHKQRIAQDPEFAYIFEDIARFKAEKEDKTISLNQEQRLAKREARKARQLARENERRLRKGLKAIADLDELDNEEKSAEPEDPFLDEAIAITIDLVDAPKLAARIQ